MTIEEFMSELSSSSPTPGGGSVAALCGALSSSLSSMVASLTIGKKKYAEVEEEMKGIKEKAKQITTKMLNLITEDAKMFDLVMEAYKMPKETEEEKAKRKEAIEEALKNASKPPFEVMKLTKQAIELAFKVATKGNKNAISDAGAAALTAKSACKIAYFNVLINLSGISDNDYKESVLLECKSILEAVEKQADDITRQVLESIS